MEINRDILKKKHGDKADALFAEIALLGGFGEVGPAENQLDASATLYFRGVLDAENSAVSSEAKARIKSVIGGGDATKEEAKK